MGLAAPVADAADPDRDLTDLPAVDRGWYRDWRELDDGVGGMGRMFRARDRRLGREVAIKQVAGGGSGMRAALRRRFEREARLTARLQHPAIVGIYEAGRFDDGEPFYAMPLVRGVSLDVEIGRRASLAERLSLLPHLTAVCDAVAYAHGEGVVHRDLKPQNVMIGPFGETVVLDWGLARALTEIGDAGTAPFRDLPGDGLTRAGVGTPQYMAPEQAHGAPASPAMDVYALGATLYHLLAGVPPYADRDGGGARAAVRRGPPPALVALAPDAPPELCAIAARAMAREASERFASVRELADELRRFQTGQLLRSHRYSPREVVRHLLRRYRRVLSVAGIAAVVVMTIAVVAVVRITRAQRRSEASERAAQRELRRSRGVLASQLAATPERRLEALGLAVAAVGPELNAGVAVLPEAARGLVDVLVAGPIAVRLPDHVGSGIDLAYSGDGAHLATLGDDHELRLWDARTGALVAHRRVAVARPYAVVFDGHGRLAVGSFSPSLELWDPGRDLAVQLTDGDAAVPWLSAASDGLVVGANDGTLVRWQGDRVTARAALGHGVVALAIGPAGEVAAGLDDGAVAVWPVDRGAVAWYRGHVGAITGVGFDAAGRLLSVAMDGRLVRWRDPDAADELYRAPEGQPIYGLRVAPDRRRVAVADGATTVLGLGDGLVEATLDGAPGIGHGFAEDGRLATIGPGGAAVWDLDGSELVHVDPGPADPGAGVALAPDGTRLVTRSRGRGAFLWDARVGAATGRLPAHASAIVAVAVAGDRILTGGLDGSVRVIDASRGRVVAPPVAAAEVAGARWSDDGRRAAWWDHDGAIGFIDRDGRARGMGDVAALDVAFDGDAALVGSAAGAVFELRVDGGRVTRAKTTVAVERIAAAHGRVAIGGGDGSVGLVADDGGVITVGAAAGAAVTALAFAPDGAHLLAGWAGGPARIFRVADRAVVAQLDGEARAWSGDGRQVAVATAAGATIIGDIAGGARTLDGRDGLVLAAAFGPDGATFATASQGGVVVIWDLGTATPRLRIAAGLGAATAIAFSAAGDAVVVGYASGAVRVWPATIAAAQRRACGLLAEFGRRDLVAAHCR